MPQITISCMLKNILSGILYKSVTHEIQFFNSENRIAAPLYIYMRERDTPYTSSWASITKQAPHHILIQVTDSSSLGLIRQCQSVQICLNSSIPQSCGSVLNQSTIFACHVTTLWKAKTNCFWKCIYMPVPTLLTIEKCL